MAEAVQVHFTLEDEGLRAHYHGWKVYMNSYMKEYKSCLMVLGPTQLPADNANDIYGLLMRTKDPHKYNVITLGSCVSDPHINWIVQLEETLEIAEYH